MADAGTPAKEVAELSSSQDTQIIDLSVTAVANYLYQAGFPVNTKKVREMTRDTNGAIQFNGHSTHLEFSGPAAASVETLPCGNTKSNGRSCRTLAQIHKELAHVGIHPAPLS